MKKLYIFILVLCLTFSFVFVASASDDPSEDYIIDAGVYTLKETLTDVDTLANISSGVIVPMSFVSNGQSFDAFWFRVSSSQGPVLTFRISGTSSYYYIYSSSLPGYIVDSARGTNGADFRVFELTSSHSVSKDFYDWFIQNTIPEDYVKPTFNLFDSLYRIIVQYVFNGEGVTDGILDDQMQHLVVTLFATAAWLFCVCLPFVLVYWFIKVVSTAFRRF